MAEVKEPKTPKLGRIGSLYGSQFGQKRSVQLRDFIRRVGVTLPSPPDSIDYTPAAISAIHNDYLNLSLGDCVIAAGYHLISVYSGNAGRLYTATPEQITADYSAVGGYDPRYPWTDAGCTEVDAMRQWIDIGFRDGTKIIGWANVDATNQLDIKLAIWLFEGLWCGIFLPNAWNPSTQFPAENFIWDIAGPVNPSAGHEVAIVGYNSTGVRVSTWGRIGTITWAAFAHYFLPAIGGGAMAWITQSHIERGIETYPTGLDWDGLIAQFNVFGDNYSTMHRSPHRHIKRGRFWRQGRRAGSF